MRCISCGREVTEEIIEGDEDDYVAEWCIECGEVFCSDCMEWSTPFDGSFCKKCANSFRYSPNYFYDHYGISIKEIIL